MTVFDICLIIISLSFFVLVIYLILLIVSLRKTLSKVNRSMVLLQKRVEELGHQPRDLIHTINAISADVYGKLRSLDPLFRSLHNVGEGVENKTKSFKEKTFWVPGREKLRDEFQDEDDHGTASDLLDWALLGVNIWQKFKKKRR
jgi:uncharacterized protein YoxC